MTHDELAVLEHENWIAYLTGVVRCTRGAEVTRAGGVVTVLTGLPMDWFNQVLIEGDEATPAGVLAAVAQARERGGHFVVRLREGIDDRFIPSLIEAGLAPAEGATPMPGMVAFSIDHDAIAEHASPGLDIRRMTDAAGVAIHRQVVTAGFGSDPAVAAGTACGDLLDVPECVVYVGYARGEPVVSGLAWLTGRTVGVYSVATIESARRRGYGAAMTARVVADGVVPGCDVAALQASQMGRPIYERLGFRTVVTYATYADRRASGLLGSRPSGPSHPALPRHSPGGVDGATGCCCARIPTSSSMPAT
jgi:GNAT superfamily N-acetyltransferase